MENSDFNIRMNNSINNLFKALLKLSFKSPSQTAFILKTAAAQKRAAKLRQVNEDEGLHVPAFMIASVTKSCNLHCKGCYSHVNNNKSSEDTGFERIKSMVAEAEALGIAIILLAGGEPLFRKTEITDIAKTYKEVIFPLFTNGLLIDEEFTEVLRHTRNLIPIVSIEGHKEKTDDRRGEGVYSKLKQLFRSLNHNDIFYGVSVTVTHENIEEITDEEFVSELIEDGCKIFFYTEYVPVEKDTEHLIISESQRDFLTKRLDALSSRQSAFFIAFPGDEKNFGGCIASGLGFIHISPNGSVEPCPFAPYSDSNINDKSLKQCIQSDFLTKIRNNHALLTEGQGGCALWDKKEIVKSYL